MVAVVWPKPVRTLIPGCARAPSLTSSRAPRGVVAGGFIREWLNPHPSRGKTWPEHLTFPFSFSSFTFKVVSINGIKCQKIMNKNILKIILPKNALFDLFLFSLFILFPFFPLFCNGDKLIRFSKLLARITCLGKTIC